MITKTNNYCYSTIDGLELEEDEDKGRDPFIVNERFFSKYAAMMYTSDDNARTFHEVKDARYCASCGEKVSDITRTKNLY